MEDRQLIKTLEIAGISPDIAAAAEVLAMSGPDHLENAKVHAETNRKIESALENDHLGTCIHVTGRASALTDPVHRDVLAQIVGRGKEPFKLLYNVPAEKRETARDVVAWNLQKWAERGFHSWRDRLQTIELVGYRGVDLLAYDALNEVQYTVFGEQYVQLQGLHTDDAGEKAVWLIRSPKINELLCYHAISAASRSIDVNEVMFREFALNLHGPTAKFLLRRLIKAPGMTREGICALPELMDPIEPPSEILDGLLIMGFISVGADAGLRITSSGLEFAGGI